ncbi:MAG TPA: PhzF family phenazine biosynthesis protein [Polyangiaceae bacterium]|nr:PhzF family phenazine biosynthesis protein [Polyangiaceae bacterium]
MRLLRYVRCDVFTDRAFTGNQLAVFTDARGVSPELMQALAREMNLAESVFVLRPEAGGHAKLRIFTPVHEMPFAGHPTLGSAFVLGNALQAEVIQFETGVGLVPVRLEREGARAVFGWMEQRVPTERPFERPAELLSILGVTHSELPVIEYDNGAQHAFVILKTPADVARLEPDLTRLKRFTRVSINVAAGSGLEWKTRMFAPAAGVPEDAATGSAAGPLAVHLARHGKVAFGEGLRIRQGEEIQRPSELSAVVRGSAEQIDAVEVGGAAVIVGRGEIRIDG